MYTLIAKKERYCVGLFQSYSTALAFAVKQLPTLELDPVELYLDTENENGIVGIGGCTVTEGNPAYSLSVN